MNKAKVVRMPLPEGKRILAVSDIHGCRTVLWEVLERAGFGRGDALFLLGDLVERGSESLETVRYVMELAREYEVYPLCGNCDAMVLNLIDGAGFMEHYLRTFGSECTLRQMLREIGESEELLFRPEALREALEEHFPEELAFLRGLPTVIDTGRWLFVHGGVPSLETLEETEAWRCMKNDDYLGQDPHLGRWSVVGHWPVSLYRPDEPSSEPFVDREHQVLSIDGGCAVKVDGQLNLVVLPDEGEDFSWYRGDPLPKAVALEEQKGVPPTVNVRWGRNRLELLERGAECSACRDAESGRTLLVPNGHLWTDREGILRSEDISDCLLGVSPGDTLSVVLECRDGILAKKDGITGWYRGGYRRI